jgi:hypothetical protein
VTPPDEVETGDLATGLTTDAEIEPRDGVRSLRVTWIAWDSDYRSSDLRIGDRVIAVDGTSLEDRLVPGKFASLVGQATESLGWQQAGAVPGQTVVLTVLRGEERKDISARLLSQRLYSMGADAALAPGGPAKLQADGFGSAWMGWYEDFVERMSYVLDFAWVRVVFDNRAALIEHDEWRPRIEYVEQHWPGRFAGMLRADWEAARVCLAGTAVGTVDLEYRDLGARRLEETKGAAATAYGELLAEFKDRLVPPFPVPTFEQLATSAGKVVELPVIREQDIVGDLGDTLAVARDPGGSEHYFIQLSGDPLVRGLYATAARFRTTVHPALIEQYGYVAAISERRRMITFDDRPTVGVLVDVIAARVGAEGECFVDLRDPAPDGSFTFAGESLLRSLELSVLPDTAGPDEVLLAMIAAIKTADRERYEPLFATWAAGNYDGEPFYNAAYRPAPAALDDAWERSRELLTEDVYDVRIASVGPVRRVLESRPANGLPAVDQVTCFVDHVGFFDGEYRVFMTSFVHRRWVLQRRDGGPWRIAEVQSL